PPKQNHPPPPPHPPPTHHPHPHPDLCPRLRVSDGTRGHLPERRPEGPAPFHASELPADGLKVRTHNPGAEPRPGVGQDLCAQPEFQVGPPGPHDRLVEGDERFGDAITRPA